MMVFIDEESSMAMRSSGNYLLRCLFYLVLTGLVGATFTTTDYGLTTVSTNATKNDDCTCDCRFVISFSPNMTKEQLEAEIRRIYSELLLDRNNISAIVRKRISIPDYRPSAQSIGYVGVLVLVVSIGSIVALDFTTLIKDVKAGAGNLKSIASRGNFSDLTYQSVNSNGTETEEAVHLSLTSSA